MDKRAVTFYYDECTGELSREDWGKDFQAEVGILKADVLLDLKNLIEDAYVKAWDQFLDEARDCASSKLG